MFNQFVILYIGKSSHVRGLNCADERVCMYSSPFWNVCVREYTVDRKQVHH